MLLADLEKNTGLKNSLNSYRMGSSEKDQRRETPKIGKNNKRTCSLLDSLYSLSFMIKNLSSENLGELIERFLFHCRYEKGLNEKTLKAYETDLKQFEETITKLYEKKPFESISSDEFKLYVRDLSRFKPKTIKRKVASLKTMINFIEIEEEKFINPLRKLRIKIKVPMILPTVMNRQEIVNILSFLYLRKKNDRKKSGSAYEETLRHIAVVELLFGTGIRVSELCSLRNNCVDLDEGAIKVNGKGSKERLIQICQEEILDALRTYRKHCLRKKNSGDLFFTNRLGKGLSTQSVRGLIKKIVAQSGVTKTVTPHTFRHTFATLLLEEGVDIKYIQSILGHSSLATTQIYTHVNASRQKTILKNFHPRRSMSIPR